MLKRKLLFGVALFWTALVAVLSLASLDGLGKSIPFANKDKIVHFFFYFCFVITWLSYFKTKNINPKCELKVVFCAILFGALMEILQGTLTTNRSADVFDVLANTTGAFAGLLIIRSFFK